MAPKRRYSKSTQRLRKKYGRGRGKPAWSGGASSYRARNMRTGGYLGIETKFIDYTYSDVPTATITDAEADPPAQGAQTAPGCISAIAQGDGESNRDGRKVVLKSLHIRGAVILIASADATLNDGRTIRVIVVVDTQTNGVQLNAENVILAATHVEHGFRNLQFSKRFRILKDHTFEINALAGAGTGAANDSPATVKKFMWNFPLNIPVNHTGTTAVVASIADNSIHVIAFASGDGVTLAYESRVRFVG